MLRPIHGSSYSITTAQLFPGYRRLVQLLVVSRLPLWSDADGPYEADHAKVLGIRLALDEDSCRLPAPETT